MDNKISSTNRVRILNFFIIILLSILVYVYHGNTSDDPITVISIMSIITLCYQVVIFRFLKYRFFSFQFLFIVMSYAFFFGNLWLSFINKDEYLINGGWNSIGIVEKYQTGLFCIHSIQMVFTGLVYKSHDTINMYEKIVTKDIQEQQKSSILYKTGIFMLLLGLPFKLLFDFQRVFFSMRYGYVGFDIGTGFVDDLMVFFVPGLICILISQRFSRNINQAIVVLFLVYNIIIMTMSGDRRYYITAILAVVIAYISIYRTAKLSFGKTISIILLGFAGIIVLNLMVIIRDNRNSYLGLWTLLADNYHNLLSLSFIWETMAEFGISLYSVVLITSYVPSFVPFQYGASYVYSFFFILPIGWMINIENASISNLINNYTNMSVGGSYLGDLYANFGWFSAVPAMLIGLTMSKITTFSENSDILKKGVGISVIYILINYIRASTMEVTRPIVYIILLYSILTRYYIFAHKRKLMKKIVVSNELTNKQY